MPLGDSHLLAQHQNVLETLNSEIRSTIGDRSDLTREDLKKMPYLDKVLKESKYL